LVGIYAVGPWDQKIGGLPDAFVRYLQMHSSRQSDTSVSFYYSPCRPQASAVRMSVICKAVRAAIVVIPLLLKYEEYVQVFSRKIPKLFRLSELQIWSDGVNGRMRQLVSLYAASLLGTPHPTSKYDHSELSYRSDNGRVTIVWWARGPWPAEMEEYVAEVVWIVWTYYPLPWINGSNLPLSSPHLITQLIFTAF
jgi:hypothetical protein